MKERPILFSAPMVRAILAGQKTQTRRAVKPQPEWTEPATAWKFSEDGHSGAGWYAYSDDYPEEGALFYRCPYGQPGDRLWVRETWADLTDTHGQRWERWDEETQRYERGVNPFVWYRADGDLPDMGNGDVNYAPWRPSIFMPRWASRILLEVVSIRVERLNNISGADAIAEGIERTVTGDGWRRYADPETESVGLPPCQYPRHSYRSLWERINGPEAWDTNPWVWVITFKRVES